MTDNQNGTALIAREREFDAPAVFGSREEIKAVTDRMRVMLPNARLADWQLSPKYKEEAERNLNSALFNAAQLAVFYRLIPGQDVHIIPFGNNFAVDLGIETWQKAADRYSRLLGVTYHVVTEPMPAEELKKRRGNDYDPEDCGAICYLWRSDKQQVYQMFGKSALTAGYGVWRKKAKWNKNKNQWDSDPVQEHRTPQDVADRRALKMVLKKEFSLDALLAATPAEERANLDKLENQIEVQRRAALPVAEQPIARDDDDMLYWGEEGHYRDVDETTGEIPAGSPAAAPDFYDLPDEPFPTDTDEAPEPDNPFETDIDYAALVDILGDKCRQFAQWCRQKHLSSDGPCTKKQYGYLRGTINGLTGQDDSHYAILHVLIGREVTSKSPPGFDLTSKLLDWLPEESGPEGEKVQNPNYKKEYAQCVLSIHRVIREALGQLELPLAA